jgi:PAS domain-containing protein
MRIRKPRVPPLRFAPVGMTILLCPQKLQREILTPVTDAETRITRMNSVAEHLTGWPIKEAEGELLADVFHIGELFSCRRRGWRRSGNLSGFA